jgi:hypothetical protein
MRLPIVGAADAANHPTYPTNQIFWCRKGRVSKREQMTIPETAARVRVALCYCVNADEGVSSTERRYFHAVQLNSTDEEVISFWLSVSYLDKHHVPMFVAKQWAKQANDLNEWMALLERNTAPPGRN